jgi:hypothetical protein
MYESTETQRRVQRWFRAKRRELLASAELAEDHPSLIGGHREFFTRQFLGNFLPGRLSADRGIIYDAGHHSGGCDVVIWDSANFPRLAMLDHSSFFAESVVAVVEIKSNYSKAEFDACRVRCESIRRLRLAQSMGMMRFRDELTQIWHHIDALRAGVEHAGGYWANLGPAYLVVFLKGGENVDLARLVDDRINRVHDDFPDAVAFVDAGTFVRRYEPSQAELDDGEDPALLLYSDGEDVLMELTDELLRAIGARSFGTDGLYDLGGYMPWSFTDPEREIETMRYPFTHFASGYRASFGDAVPDDPDHDDD